MTMTAVSQCSECKAMVNIHWPVCLVCRAPVTRHGVSAGSTATAPPGNTQATAKPRTLPLLYPGDVVAWMSPALPRQQADVLAVHDDDTFEVLHPLTEVRCRLPMNWILRDEDRGACERRDSTGTN